MKQKFYSEFMEIRSNSSAFARFVESLPRKLGAVNSLRGRFTWCMIHCCSFATKTVNNKEWSSGVFEMMDRTLDLRSETKVLFGIYGD